MSFFLRIYDKLKKKFTKENFFLILIISMIFSIDRISKNLILNNFSEKTHYINEYLNFNLTWNTGIGFGLLSSDSNIFYNSISLIIGSVILFLIYLTIKSNRAEKITFSLIIGGALGNFYDRTFFKAVPDFIDVHIGNFHWFTFNVADIFITIGILIFLLKEIFIKEDK